MINSRPIHGNSCLYKTYNYHELITNYHQLNLFSYLWYVLIITKSEMIIFHCFSCFWASLGLLPWAIARYAPAVLHPNLLQNQLKTIES